MSWWKKTDFWIAFVLMVIGIVGIARGNKAIADPGQDAHPQLAWLYLLAALIMLINGLISHRQYLRDHAKVQTDKNVPSQKQEA
jgi:cell division protein FtsW (lipid II flippase)